MSKSHPSTTPQTISLLLSYFSSSSIGNCSLNSIHSIIYFKCTVCRTQSSLLQQLQLLVLKTTIQIQLFYLSFPQYPLRIVSSFLSLQHLVTTYANFESDFLTLIAVLLYIVYPNCLNWFHHYSFLAVSYQHTMVLNSVWEGYGQLS